MNVATRPKIVVLGMMTKMPVAGVVWQTVHYLVGFERLGYEAYYVEAHARTPSMFMEREEDDGSGRAAAFIERVMSRFGLQGRWGLHALHDDGRCYGMSESALAKLYRSAALIINLHGGTVPREEHFETGRLIYLETDPVELQIELHHNVRETIEFLEPHCAFFTFGENYGRPGCPLPVSDRFRFKPTRQPVVCDFWDSSAKKGNGTAGAFTTIGNWQQPWRRVTFEGQVYHWSKHFEFLKFLNLPRRTTQSFELALSSYEPVDQHLLESQGWRVVNALDFSTDLDAYRRYIAGSRGEFTVAKDQNVRLKSGWFSDRSATYLAAGRPVVTQETGFDGILPTGRGLFGFASLDDILAALDDINSHYTRHCTAAREIAHEYFSHEKVLGKILEDVGLPRRWEATTADRRKHVLPDDLVVTPVSRFPTVLPDATIRTVLDAPLPWPAGLGPNLAVGAEATSTPFASIAIVTRDNLAFNRMCLECLLRETDVPSYEVIVVDNGSTDGTPDYLRTLGRRFSHIRPILNAENRGFAAATNQGLRAARGDVLVLLNNDTLVTPGWLEGLSRHLLDDEIGLVGCLTNRCGNEAELETDYRTFGELLDFSHECRRCDADEFFDIRAATMFCLAMRRATFERLGPLDERFEIGLFEDDDYSMRARVAGLRVVCASDVFIHHFGQASLGRLASGEYGRLFHANRLRWEEKWGQTWRPYERKTNPRYEQLRERFRQHVGDATPPAALLAIVSKGDEDLLQLDGRRARHFPAGSDGKYAGHHPADDAHAIGELEKIRGDGAEFFVLPATALWWLDYYGGLRRHLEQWYQPLFCDPETCVIYDLRSSETAERRSAGAAFGGKEHVT
jgi:GT2 family glycosyltransferase